MVSCTSPSRREGARSARLALAALLGLGALAPTGATVSARAIRKELGDVTWALQWAAPAVGTSFDLSSMTLPALAKPYTIFDIRNPTTAYFFNLGADVSPPDPSCPQMSSNAFQVENYNVPQASSCYRVGGPSVLGWNFSLYDTTKPARGVSITMLNGDQKWCPVGQNRTFTVSLLCAPVPTSTAFPPDANVFELNTCDYRMELKSVAGCPTQCTSGGVICGGNGVCGFDTDTSYSKCFCYTGFAGSGCTAIPSGPAGLSAESIILIIVCLVLAAVIALVAFMFLKLRKLQVDPAAYGELQGRFNELGMLA